MMIPLFYKLEGSEIEICTLDEPSLYFLVRKNYLQYDRFAEKSFVKDMDLFLEYCNKMRKVKVYRQCLNFLKEVKKMADLKNPCCTIKDEPILTCGGLVDVVIASKELVPCPKCKSNELQMTRNISFSPMGFRLGCPKCGFSVPESLEDSAYTTEEGVELASSTWEKYAGQVLGEEVFGQDGKSPIQLEEVQEDDDTYYLDVKGERIDLNTMEFLDKMTEN